MNDKNHLTDIRFDYFPLSTKLLDGLAEAGFEFCTPIQAATLPYALEGKDVAGQAQTGTGKTAAFLVATLHHLEQRPPSEKRRPSQPRALILVPTRELAMQIEKDARPLIQHTGHRLLAVYGGTGYKAQRQALQKGTDILVGTPGRLIDYFKQKVFDLRQIQVLVLDEADRMFDLGFLKDIRFLLRRCPAPSKRLNMLFSATLSYRVNELAYEHMNNPQPVKVDAAQTTAPQIDELGYMTANEEKIPLLIGLLRQKPSAKSIVFVNTKRTAETVWGYLAGNGIQAAVLSGDVPQKKRIQLLKKFSEGQLAVLVATDVAARGLHIPHVTHVINYDLPEDAQDYVHRIGRTGRAGQTGTAISFVCETYAFFLPDIEDYIGHKIPMQPVTEALLADVDPKSRRYPRSPKRHANTAPRKHPKRRRPRARGGKAS